MSVRFRGSFKKLISCAARIDADGQWRPLKYGCQQYRTADGAVLNWWPKSGKITFQGHKTAAAEFEWAFVRRARKKGRLSDERLDLSDDRVFIHWFAARLYEDKLLLRRARELAGNIRQGGC